MNWFRYLIFFIFAYMAVRWLKSFLSQPEKERNTARTLPGEDMVKDPNCNTYIPLKSAIMANIKGKSHYFCSKECEKEFRGR